MSRTKLLAYWTARREDAEGCADRIARFLEALTRIDPVFDRWYGTGRSRKAALRSPLQIDQHAICDRLLTSGLAAKSPPMPDIGFSFYAWNGAADGHDCSISVHCGSYSTVPNTPPNSIVLDLPYEDPEATRLQARKPLREILAKSVEAFDPESAAAVTGDTTPIRREGRAIRPLGMFTYFRVNAARIASILDRWHVEPLGQGALVWTDAAEDRAGKMAREGAERLARHGILI